VFALGGMRGPPPVRAGKLPLRSLSIVDMLTIIDKEHFMTTASIRSALDKPDRIAVFGVSIVALCFAAVFLLLGAFDAIRTLFAESVHLSVDADAPLGALGRLPGVSGRYDGADLQVRGLDAGARALLAGGNLLGALATVAIALAVAWLCRGILRDSAPFTRSLTRLTRFCALVLVIVPTAAHFLVDLGTNIAIDQLGLHHPVLIGFRFDMLPWIVGVVLAVVGELFRRGERLQRDLQGLV